MHAGSHYNIKEFLLWTRREIYLLLVLATVPVLLYQLLNWKWLAIPWVPIALVGTAAAFIVGFKNTQTYNRLWEARQIWGAILNGSRAWGIMCRDFISADSEEIRSLLYRHCAWLTALRYQLREPKVWENLTKSYNQEYLKHYKIPERETPLEDELKKYLSAEELKLILSKKNRSVQLIALQSEHLRRLRQAGQIEALEYIELEKRLADFYDQQGKCERIKNFPYPRQFASITLFFVRLFVFLLPFGMLAELQKLGDAYVWLAIPLSTMVSWVFVSMDKVGESSENPFEGSANDVPMTAMSRTIEIDLRELLGESDLPAALQPINNILL